MWELGMYVGLKHGCGLEKIASIKNSEVDFCSEIFLVY